MRDESVKMHNYYRIFINIREYDFHKFPCPFYLVWSVLSQVYKEKKKDSESQRSK